MKVSGRSIALAVAGAALATGVLAAPATADGSQVSAVGTTTHIRGDGTQPPAELGNPTEWGVVELTMNDSAGSISPMTIVEIGGGTWSYGWYLTADGKYCYSNYYHHDVMHGSTAELGGSSIKHVVVAGEYSNAHLTGGAGYTCNAYYAKY
ncbi:lactococcin 972 family bacteriocin [Streptomyces sp. NPDC060223]|uniref:lactococcin 972 family bacteriocin n=1 Tax=unclassified Streptomyces TaxID=2593676 RepID=UPI00362A0F41